MKIANVAVLLACGLILVTAGTGCRKKPSYLTPLHGQQTRAPGDLTPATPIDTGGKEGTGGVEGKDNPYGIPANPPGRVGWNENAEALKAQTVYFDFDSSAVRGSEQSKVTAVAEYLKSNATAAVRVEGHCDERGTEGYNQSLGERRATAIREELVRLGIAPTRVDTTTFGEMRPAVQGSDESAYRLNRRGEFIVLTPP